MKGRTGSTLSRTKYVKCFRVETSCYRVVLRLKFIVTVELLYEQAESDCGPLPLGSAVNLNKLNLIEIELFIKMLYGVWSSLKPDHETKQISAPDAGQPSSQVADLKHLKTSYIFSPEDKYNDEMIRKC